MTLRNPWMQSTMIHLGFFILIFVAIRLPEYLIKRRIDFEVLQYPTQSTTPLQISPKIQEKPKLLEKRAVFGVSRRAIVASDNQKDSAEIKQGNTIAKEQDDLTLNQDDADSLPIPADSYLLTSMPKLKADVRVPYPRVAERAGIEGPVILDLLIDASGTVRKVDLVRGPGYGLDEAAVNAAQKFQFSPGHVGEKAVAVKIRYTYRFVLENQ